MDSQTRKALVRKQAAVKARMTHIKKYIDSLPDTVDVHDVNVRLQLLQKVGKNITLYRISWNIMMMMKRSSMR
jgi:hypothetical protein